MSDILVFVIFIIISPGKFQLIFDRPSIEEIRNSKKGTMAIYEFENSQDGLLNKAKEKIDRFRGEMGFEECFFSRSPKDAGFIGKNLPPDSMISDEEIQKFARKMNLKINDPMTYALYCRHIKTRKSILQ